MSLIENKKAHFNYEILEKFEAGIELLGHEVKSLKGKQGSLEGAYVIIRGGEAYLINANIPAYQPANAPAGFKEERPRKLLLQKQEISRLIGSGQNQGLTCLPIRLYTVKGKIKLEFALAKKRKKGDKRQIIKKREAEREMRRNLSS